eukprot:8828889-Lingulodinium_polyedra.AAC.1
MHAMSTMSAMNAMSAKHECNERNECNEQLNAMRATHECKRMQRIVVPGWYLSFRSPLAHCDMSWHVRVRRASWH